MTTPFYQKALALFTRTQTAQIKKGLAKYPEPFNPHNWTPEQLLNHALEETVDLTHYLVGLKELLDEKDKEISDLKYLLAQAKEKYEYRPITGDPLSPLGPFISRKGQPRDKYDMNFNPTEFDD